MRVRKSGRTLRSTTTSLEIIDVLIELEGARVSEVADVLDVSKSTAYNHLHTLQEAGYVVLQGDEYHPGLKFAFVGQHAKMCDDAYQDAIEITQQLDEQTRFETGFIVEENGVGRYLKPEVDQTNKYGRFALTGEKEYLHTTAAGKAILATFTEDHIDKIINQVGLPKETEQTINSRGELIAELDDVQDQGYAINRGENRDGIYAIAQAAQKPNGSTVGAMSITSPSYRTKEDEFDKHATKFLSRHIERLEDRLRSNVQ